MRTVRWVAVMCGLIVGAGRVSGQTISLEIVPSSQQIILSELVTVMITIAGLSDEAAPSLGTFDLDLIFDPALLSCTSATIGDPTLGDQLDLRGLGRLAVATPDSGIINLFALSFDSPEDLNMLQAGAFVLATITCNTLAPGTSPLSLRVNALGDAVGDVLPADVGGGSITVFAPPVVFHCSAGDVSCLIRSIKLANTLDDETTINLETGTYTLTAVDNDTDGPNGLPSITSPIILIGAGAIDCAGGDLDCTTIARSMTASDVFRIIHVANTGVLTLDGIVITGGDASDSSGGGIFNAGTLTVTNSTIRENRTTSNGGGISNQGTLTVTNSTISSNNPDRSGASGNGGGGIFNAGTLTVTNSTISNNFHDLHGGGISNQGTLTVTNSTIYGNTGELGGGISNEGGTATVISSTISNNLSDGLGGGGILSDDMLTVRHSIIAGNFFQNQELEPFPPPQHNDCDVVEERVTSQGHNLVGKDTGCPSNGPGDLTVESDAVFTTVLDEVLANHGGPTETQALLLVSFNPAINAGARVCTDASGTPLRQDQRGEPRPRGTACDIGAFEVTQPPPPVMCRGRRATIVGTPGDDVLIGTVGVDVIHGLDGDDVIDGLDGHDIICGGDGHDIIFGGDGRDRLFGNRGNDMLDGGDGRDFCDGGAGRDTAVNCEPAASVANVP